MIVVPGLALLIPAAPAAADHSVTHYSNVTAAPNWYFLGNTSDTDNSDLNAYMTNAVDGKRYRISARAGSGSGSTNNCATNSGWLPEGTYGRGDGDSKSRMERMYKTWGDTVVRGNVWFLDRKTCSNGSVTRTELFIHSNGIEGTSWNSNWKTLGCIKVSQHARNGYMGYYWSAYQGDNDALHVSY